jgi:hypothetical protein
MFFDGKEEKMQEQSEQPIRNTNGTNNLTRHGNLLCRSGMWTRALSYPCTIIETVMKKQSIIHFFLLALPLLCVHNGLARAYGSNAPV